MKSILLIIFASFCLCVAHADEKVKNINDHFNVSASTKLSIENKHGKVLLYTWDKNEITVDIVIKTKAATASKAQDLMDDIRVERSGNENSKIVFKTIVDRKQVTIRSGDDGMESGMSIDYTVHMPRRSALELTNSFGPVTMEDFEGSLDLTVKYGALKVGKLTGSEKKITVGFGSADIERIAFGKFDISYSKLDIGSAETIAVKNMFGKTNIKDVRSLSITQKYGGLIVGNVDAMSGTVEFAEVKVNNISKRVEMGLKYSSTADFGNIKGSVETVKISGSFSNVTFELANDASFTADVRTSFGSFKNRSGIGLNREDEGRFSHGEHHTGRIGRGSGKLLVETQYGDITFR